LKDCPSPRNSVPQFDAGAPVPVIEPLRAYLPGLRHRVLSDEKHVTAHRQHSLADQVQCRVSHRRECRTPAAILHRRSCPCLQRHAGPRTNLDDLAGPFPPRTRSSSPRPFSRSARARRRLAPSAAPTSRSERRLVRHRTLRGRQCDAQPNLSTRPLSMLLLKYIFRV